MFKYTATIPLGFGPGAVLGLTKKQAEPRKHLLKALGKDLYEVVDRVEFKVGETIQSKQELSKAMLGAMESQEDVAARQATAAAAAQTAQEELAELRRKADLWDEVQPELAALRAAAEVATKARQ